MPRLPRINVPGGVYHVIARGNNRAAIFHDPSDRQFFLERLAFCRRRFRFFLYAYCLMGNHFHLALELGSESLSRIMHALLFLYSQRFNRRYDRVGHLFQGRFGSRLVQKDKYLTALLRYIHDNPVRAGLVATPESYVWSSARYYQSGTGPDWLDFDRPLAFLGRIRRPQRSEVATHVEFPDLASGSFRPISSETRNSYQPSPRLTGLKSLHGACPSADMSRRPRSPSSCASPTCYGRVTIQPLLAPVHSPRISLERTGGSPLLKWHATSVEPSRLWFGRCCDSKVRERWIALSGRSFRILQPVSTALRGTERRAAQD